MLWCPAIHSRSHPLLGACGWEQSGGWGTARSPSQPHRPRGGPDSRGKSSPLRLHIRITWEHFKLSHSPQTNESLVDPCEQGPGVDTQIDPHCSGDFTVSQGWKPPRPSGSEDLRSFSATGDNWHGLGRPDPVGRHLSPPSVTSSHHSPCPYSGQVSRVTLGPELRKQRNRMAQAEGPFPDDPHVHPWPVLGTIGLVFQGYMLPRTAGSPLRETEGGAESAGTQPRDRAAELSPGLLLTSCTTSR